MAKRTRHTTAAAALPKAPGERKGRASYGSGLEAGQGSRRLRHFTPSREHINGLLAQVGDTVVARARYLIRNNGYASQAVDSWAASCVGAGIVPASLARTARQRKAIGQAWLDWTDAADAEGLTDWYGMMRRAAREVFVAGEVFLRARPRRPEDALAVPLQYQMLPAEMLPLEKTEQLSDGRWIRQGIEFDRIGRRVAYWFHRRHPNDATDIRAEAELYTRVPAAEVIHVFDPVEAGQIRGISRLAPAIVKLFQLDAYNDAELDRKKVAAMFAAFVTMNAGEPESTLKGVEDNGDGTGIAPLEPGLLQILRPGQDIKFAEPADVGGSYEPFQYRTLLEVCAALGLPYQAVSGDVLKANYSNIRASWVEFRRKVEAFQWSVLVFQMCRPAWLAWMRTAVLAGAVPVPAAEFLATPAAFLKVKFTPPKWEWVDPLKDMQAESLAVRNGFKARADVVEGMGDNAEQVDERIAADNARADRLGLVLDSDPRRTSASGSGGASPGQDGDADRDGGGARREDEDPAERPEEDGDPAASERAASERAA